MAIYKKNKNVCNKPHIKGTNNMKYKYRWNCWQSLSYGEKNGKRKN